MPKSARKIACDEADRHALEQLAFGRAAGRRPMERAQMVLGCLDGKQITEIAQAFDTRPNTVIKWRDRFARMGVGGLDDAPRPGAKRVYDEDFRDRVLGLLDTPPPRGRPSWDGPAVASVLKCSPHAVWRVLRKEGLCLRRRRSWSVGTGPEFTCKTLDIMGLYLDPPLKALVIGVVERPGTPAREGRTGYVLSDCGKTVRALRRVSRRRGVLDLAAALQAGTGETPARLTEAKREEEFLAFLDAIIADTPAEQETHLILDHGPAFKPREAWLGRHGGGVFLHVSAAPASWLEQAEIWFGLLSARELRGPAAPPAAVLKQAVIDFMAGYGPRTRPFRWRRRAGSAGRPGGAIANL